MFTKGYSTALVIAYLIWKGSYNEAGTVLTFVNVIAYLIWKGSYNGWKYEESTLRSYSISDLERKL